MSLSVEDRMAIQDLYSRYCVTIDNGDAEGWASTYAPDGVFHVTNLDVRVEGHEALVSFAAETHEREQGLTRHYHHNVLLDQPDGGNLMGTADIGLLDLRGGGDARIIKTARCQDLILKHDGRWVFKERVLIWDTPHVPEAIGPQEYDESATNPVTGQER